MSTKVAPRTLQGTHDYLPERMLLRHHVMTTLRDTFERFGFEPLETPAIEYAETLQGKYGEEADKLIYTFEDRGGRAVGLRYDLTVPLARVVAQYPELPRPFKRYQIAPVWRAERPQKGRYRQFWQCDVDTVGTSSMLADAEVINVTYVALKRLGFPQFTIRLNNRKILNALVALVGVPADQALGFYRALDKLDKIGESGVRAELAERGYSIEVMDRLFDLVGTRGDSRSLLAELRGRFADLPEGLTGVSELEQILDHLTSAGVAATAYRVDLSVIRGLDYYTGPVVETVVEEPRIGSITGGGRYDGLVGMFSAQPVPATGLSLGLERLVDVMEAIGIRPPGLGRTVTQLLVAVFPDTVAASLELAAGLREAGLRVEVSLEPARLDKQLRYAERRGVPYVAILGADELAAGTVVIKDLTSREQVTIPREQVAAYLAGRFGAGG